MKIIEMLCDRIEEEIKDAKFYSKKAIAHKEDYPELSKTFISIAEQEMGHVSMLHDVVTNIIANYRKEHGDPPASMMAVYDYLHKKQINKAAEVKNLIQLYKE